MANELKDVDVTFISLVKKAANRQVFLYKSADYKEDQEPVVENEPVVKNEAGEQDEETKQAKGLLQVIKNFFSPSPEQKVEPEQKEEVSKASYLTFTERINNFRMNVWDAFNTLGYVIDDILWLEYDKSNPDNGEPLAAIEQACNEFVAHCRELGSKVGVYKMAEESGHFIPSITKENISVMKSIAESLNKGITNIEKGDDQEMEKQELQELLGPIAKGIEDLATRIDKIEQANVEKAEQEKKEQEAAELAKAEQAKEQELKETLAAIQKSIEGLDTRLTQMEEARGIKKSDGDAGTDTQGTVEKSADPWEGLLPGLD